MQLRTRCVFMWVYVAITINVTNVLSIDDRQRKTVYAPVCCSLSVADTIRRSHAVRLEVLLAEGINQTQLRVRCYHLTVLLSLS